MSVRSVIFALGLVLSLPVPVLAGGILSQVDPAVVQALKTYCKADIQRLCPNVQPGGGRIKDCLMANKEQMSLGCAKALLALKQAKPQ